MIDVFEKDEGSCDCAVEISGLVEKEFLFKVEVKGQLVVNFEPTYRVKRVTDDSEIIKNFKCMAVDVDKESDCDASVSLSKFSVHPTASSFQPQNLLSQFEGSSSNACHDLAQDFEIEQVLPALLVEGEESSLGKNKKDDAGGFTNKKPPSKRMTVKIEKP